MEWMNKWTNEQANEWILWMNEYEWMKMEWINKLINKEMIELHQ